MQVLVIAAHPDDEVIGAGGTILRHVELGDQVYLCVVTQGYPPLCSEKQLARNREQVHAAQQALGIEHVFFCGFPTVRLNTVPYQELSSALQQVVDEVRPQVVYTTSPSDINQDHRLVHDATLVATRPLPGCPVRRVLAYEIGPNARLGLPGGAAPFVPNVFVDITPYLEKKLEAMRCYQSELREPPHPRSLRGLRLQAQERGWSVGLEAAECFQLIRELS